MVQIDVHTQLSKDGEDDETAVHDLPQDVQLRTAMCASSADVWQLIDPLGFRGLEAHVTGTGKRIPMPGELWADVKEDVTRYGAAL